MVQGWLVWVSACLVAGLVWRWSWLTCNSDEKRLIDPIGAALIVLAWHTNIWAKFSQGYIGDSIYNLSLAGRAGLVVLTALLVLLLIYLSQRKSRWLQHLSRVWSGGGLILLAFDLLFTALLLVIALTIAPQLYYSYYHVLFEDLPRQWVIKTLPLAIVGHILRVPQEANLAAHTAGLCSWWLLVLVLLSWLRTLRLARPAWCLAGMALLTNLAWHFYV